jgi:ribose transport system permease protein
MESVIAINILCASIAGGILGALVTPFVFMVKERSIWQGLLVGFFVGTIGGFVLLLPLWLLVAFKDKDSSLWLDFPTWTPHLLKTLPFLLLIVLWVIFSGEERFTDSRNIENIFRSASIIGMAAVGLTLIMLTGGIDFSSYGLLPLAGVVAVLVSNREDSATMGILAALGIGLYVGIVQGGLVGVVGLPSYLVTLASGACFLALGIYLTGSQLIQLESATFIEISGKEIAGVPTTFVVLVALVIFFEIIALLVNYVQRNSQLATINLVPESAFPKVGLIIVAYGLGGLLTSAASVIFVSRIGAAAPNIGTGIWLQIVAAAVLGGTSPFGKYGWVMGSLLGAISVAILQNGLLLRGLAPYNQDLILGGLVLGWLILHVFVGGRSALKAADTPINASTNVLPDVPA